MTGGAPWWAFWGAQHAEALHRKGGQESLPAGWMGGREIEDTGRRGGVMRGVKGLLGRGSVERFRDRKSSFTKTGDLGQYTPGTEQVKRCTGQTSSLLSWTWR